ncbi:hypothetical protein [Streptomyces sp. NPDC051662]|uniref:hypothetical protein n=1 Tax=Streptomyces sp. NPDC051662 TaxID=3154750 RepID=UPI003425DDEB
MQMKARTALAAATLALSAGLVAAPSASAGTTAQSPRQDTSASQSCWNGSAVRITGGMLQYQECRRTYGGTTQSSLNIRVQDTRTDGYCAEGRGDIGNSANSAGRRVWVTDCSTNGSWSAWKRSGWWNGNEGYVYLYLVAG